MARGQVNLVASATLEDCERCIVDYIEKYVIAGQALLEIYDNELWRNGDYASFEDYVTSRWDFTRVRAVQLMQAGKFVRSLAVSEPKLRLPESETHIRPLMKIRVRRNEDESIAWERRVQAWRVVVDKADGEGEIITAPFVESVVQRFFKGGDVVKKVKVPQRKIYSLGDVEEALAIINDVASQLSPQEAVDKWGDATHWEGFDDALMWLRHCDAVQQALSAPVRGDV